ncbi:YciI family protein [Caldimonas brevitalea]|uniref:YCII-related domain-containing protein n=1 Tax=Caldimonas brevitalea TaxID=413882 RepID=A0A0G3BWU3_9BURK|nr:YciI family protein [Caldimonas brevitalea]AKJ31831.1 hypothetical protein AAW51_5140 [Caldimonas brevitalea]
MRFMILVRAAPQGEVGPVPEHRLRAAMAEFRELLARAGVLLDASGLQASRAGWQLRGAHGKPEAVQAAWADDTGPRLAGYTVLQVRSRDEALEWARRFPAAQGEGVDAEVEVRQLYELDDLAPHRVGEYSPSLWPGLRH